MKKIVAAIMAVFFTTTTSSVISVCAEDKGIFDFGFVSLNATIETDNNIETIPDAQFYDKLVQLIKDGDSHKYRGYYSEQLNAYIDELSLDESNIKYELEELPDFITLNNINITTASHPTDTTTTPPKAETSKNGDDQNDTLTNFGTGGLWSNPENSDSILKNMTLNEVVELSKKGNDLDWADFKGYNGKDVGSGQDIWEYKFDDGYVLRVIGVTDKKPDYILLSRNNDKEIDIRTDDVEAFIAEMNTNNDPMSLKGTKPMALDDIKALAKKGSELTWSDFEAYSGRKCGTPFDMLAYIYEIDEGYYLFVSGAVDGAPDKVQLCHYNEHISVDVLTGDVETFIAEYSNYELPDIGYTFDEIYNMTEDEVRTVFKEKGLTDTEKYHVYPQRNGNTAVDNDSMTILLYPENYMINLTDHELVTHVTDMNDRDKLFKDSDIVWDSEKVRKSLGLPEEYFNIYVESSMGVIKSAPEGEEPDIRKYCKCSIRCTSKDKDKIADLRRAALNYIQLNPDFALVYHETSGGENVLTPEKNLKGDANCDGQVDLSDAVMIMQALANPNKYGIDGTAEHHLTEQGKLNGDMDGDGLTVYDAQVIQEMLLGLDISNNSQCFLNNNEAV